MPVLVRLTDLFISEMRSRYARQIETASSNKRKMETTSPSMATQTPADMSSGTVQQHFSVQSTGTQAVSIVSQDPSKGVYIVDPSQHAALQMFSEQRLIAAAASSSQVELNTNSNASASPQTIVVRKVTALHLFLFIRLPAKVLTEH